MRFFLYIIICRSNRSFRIHGTILRIKCAASQCFMQVHTKSVKFSKYVILIARVCNGKFKTKYLYNSSNLIHSGYMNSGLSQKLHHQIFLSRSKGLIPSKWLLRNFTWNVTLPHYKDSFRLAYTPFVKAFDSKMSASYIITFLYRKWLLHQFFCLETLLDCTTRR